METPEEELKLALPSAFSPKGGWRPLRLHPIGCSHWRFATLGRRCDTWGDSQGVARALSHIPTATGRRVCPGGGTPRSQHPQLHPCPQNLLSREAEGEHCLLQRVCDCRTFGRPTAESPQRRVHSGRAHGGESTEESPWRRVHSGRAHGRVHGGRVHRRDLPRQMQ